jgi:hypothetical protein
MSSNILSDRKNALENEFFARQEKEALEAMRARNAAKATRDALSDASGITDSDVLAALESAGIAAETLAALSLVPLVVVAWADGKLDDAERSAIEKAAEEAKASDDTRALLQGWLSAPPAASLLEAWKGYIEAVLPTLSDSARAELQSQLIGGARRVAEAAGGFLGFGNKVSSEEAAALDELAACFKS